MTMETAAANADYGTTASGSSFYAAMRILPRAQREAMFQIYSFCRQVDDIADSDGPRPERLAALQQWRDDVDALYQGRPPERLKDYVSSVKTFGLKREDFLAIIDGMEMDVPQDIRAPDMATLDLYCDRVASAVGRLSVRVFGLPEQDGILLAHHLGRALQLTNILRDIDEDAGLGRLYLPREGLLHAGITGDDPAKVIAERTLPKVCLPLVERAKSHFEQADAIMKRNSRRRGARAADHVEILSRDTGASDCAGLCRPARAGARHTNGRRSPSFSATRSSDAEKRSHHRRRYFGPLRSRAAGECELQGACPRGDAAGRRPLPVLFRRRHQPHHRQRQPSAVVRQPPRAGLRPLDRDRGGAGRTGARAVSVRRYLAPTSAGCSTSATAACRYGCSTRRAASPTPVCAIIWH